MKNTKKKGFTIVELVIVIAVIRVCIHNSHLLTQLVCEGKRKLYKFFKINHLLFY